VSIVSQQSKRRDVVGELDLTTYLTLSVIFITHNPALAGYNGLLDDIVFVDVTITSQDKPQQPQHHRRRSS